jgi:hypothetical protein
VDGAESAWLKKATEHDEHKEKSLRMKPENSARSIVSPSSWIPACAGMTVFFRAYAFNFVIPAQAGIQRGHAIL